VRVDEGLYLLNGLDAVQARHHEVSQDVADFLAGEKERGRLHYGFLPVVNELTLVNLANLS
jgi:hypothetical protein